VATGEAVRTIKTPGAVRFDSIAFEPDGDRVVVTSNRNAVCFFLSKPAESVFSGVQSIAAFTTSRVRFIVQSRVIDCDFVPFETSYHIAERHQFSSSALLIGLTHDGSHAIGVRERNRPVLIAVNAGTVVVELDHAARIKHPVAVSTAPDCVALCDGRTLRVFDTSGLADIVPGKRSKPVLPAVLTVEAPDGVKAWSPPVAFTPDGRGMLVGGPRERVQMWDVPSGEKRFEWNWRLEKLTSLAVAPDGLTAAAGGRLGRVVVWDLE
jgi:WD40 repeat protein